jgi:predicted GNAT family N-acyltransferase
LSTRIVLPRKFPVLEGAELTEIHGNVKPLESYRSDKLSAIVSFDSLGKGTVTLPIYRISPLGVELEIQNAVISNGLAQVLKVGSRVNLSVTLGTHVSTFKGLTVATNHFEGGRSLIGIRWVDTNADQLPSGERRSGKRWICGEDYLPLGIAPNPIQFNDFIYFKVKDVSRVGVKLTTSLRNKILIRGVFLDSTISFPTVGQIHLTLEIQNAGISQEDGKEFLSIGAKWVEPETRALEVIGQYLLQFNSSSSIQQLRAEGFMVRSASDAFSYSFVKTEQDYLDVLSLRKEAYSGVGKLDPSLPTEKAGDLFDSRARILTVRHHGKMVGSMRIMFHGEEDETEHEQFTKFPSHFPPKLDMAEVTRICTHSSFRGSDLFHGIIQQMVLIPAQANRRWILGSATPKLLPMYLRIGFVATDVKFSHVDLGNEEHVVMLIDIPKLLCGQGVGPVLWNRLYSEMLIYLKDNHGFVMTPLDRLRVSIYKTLGLLFKLPIIRSLVNR